MPFFDMDNATARQLAPQMVCGEIAVPVVVLIGAAYAVELYGRTGGVRCGRLQGSL